MGQAHVLGHEGPDLLALEQHLQRVAGLHQARHPLRAAAAGKQADLDLGQPHAGLVVVGEHAVVAGQRQLERAAEAEAVHRGGEGLAAGLELAEHEAQAPRLLEEVAHGHLLALGRLEPLVLDPEALEHGEVGAAGEVALAGDDHAALDALVGDDRVDDPLELRHHLHGDDVHRAAGHVPGRERNAVGIDLEAEILGGGHRGTSKEKSLAVSES